MSEWIKCSDRMPEDGKHVLLWDGNTCHAGYWMEYLDRWESAFVPAEELRDITHWMEMPEPPEHE